MNGTIKMPVEIFEEVKEGPSRQGADLLYSWTQEAETKTALLLNEEADPALVAHVLDVGYASDLKDFEIDQIGRDPFLIAQALRDPMHRCVVTNEASKPSRKRQNRHIPDVCAALGVQCCDPFSLIRTLNFSTTWAA